jgi:hypothetical protein
LVWVRCCFPRPRSLKAIVRAQCRRLDTAERAQTRPRLCARSCGQRHGGDIDVSPPGEVVKPGTAIALLARPEDDRACTVDQQRPQARVAALLMRSSTLPLERRNCAQHCVHSPAIGPSSRNRLRRYGFVEVDTAIGAEIRGFPEERESNRHADHLSDRFRTGRARCAAREKHGCARNKEARCVQGRSRSVRDVRRWQRRTDEAHREGGQEPSTQTDGHTPPDTSFDAVADRYIHRLGSRAFR